MQYRTHRYQTEFPLEMRTPSGMQKGKVINVSNVGARVSGLKNIGRGDKVQLHILGYRVEAVVRWVSDDRTGVTFRPQITDDQLDTLRYRQHARQGHRRGQVGFTFAEMG